MGIIELISHCPVGKRDLSVTNYKSDPNDISYKVNVMAETKKKPRPKPTAKEKALGK